MEGLITLLDALKARHSEYFRKSWDSLSANDAKRFTQIERDIMAVNAALGKPERSLAPDLQVVLERFAANQTTDFDEATGPRLQRDARASTRRRVPRQHA